MFATDATVAAAFPLVVPDGVTLDHEPSPEDVRAAYGGWMDDRPLAGLLVSADDLTHPDRAFVVAHVNGEPVGCAFVWWGEGTAYLSGIGVLERLRPWPEISHRHPFSPRRRRTARGRTHPEAAS